MCAFKNRDLFVDLLSKWTNEKRKLNLLIVGKTGHGLSATANTILGQHLFESSLNVSSTSTEISYYQVQIQDYIIKVIDTPGLASTSEINNPATAHTDYAERLENFVEENEIHAFILVIKFGIRFTEEAVCSILLLKYIFGSSFIKNYCVIVMTYGDQFYVKHKGMSFEQWCLTQSGFFRELYDECNHRIILFDNTCGDKRDEQVSAMIASLETLQIHKAPYTHKHLKEAKISRRVVVLDVNEELSQINKELQLLRNRKESDNASMYRCLISRMENVLHTISHDNLGNDILSRAMESMDDLLNSFSD